MEEEKIIDMVMKNLKQLNELSLDNSKKIIGLIEAYAEKKGVEVVISICNAHGNMIAVCSMDDAYIASFDLSMKKAYTAVALKMSTKQLGQLAQPGQSLYGVDKIDNGKIVIIGGGIPLNINGKIVGGLGVSGGNLEQDEDIAEYGAQNWLKALQY